MKSLICLRQMIIILSLVLFVAIQVVADDTDVDAEGPSLNNQAQVEKAEQLSEKTAEQAQTAYENAQKELDQAEDNLEDPVVKEDPEAYAAAVAARDQAQADRDAAFGKLGGISAETIAGMREDGMGWGQICHELGVHPGNLGRGHTKGMKNKEFSIATSKDTQTGNSKGHASMGGGKDKGGNDGSGKAGGKNGSGGKGNGKGGGKNK